MNAMDATAGARLVTHGARDVGLRLTWITVLFQLCCALALPCLVDAAEPSAFASSPCLTQPSNSASGHCERLAREVSHDIRMARALGDDLEQAGRHADAVNAYQIALTVHPNHRDLLQGLIRARGMARSTALLSPERARNKEPTQMAAATAPAKPSGAPTQKSDNTSSQNASTHTANYTVATNAPAQNASAAPTLPGNL